MALRAKPGTGNTAGFPSQLLGFSNSSDEPLQVATRASMTRAAAAFAVVAGLLLAPGCSRSAKPDPQAESTHNDRRPANHSSSTDTAGLATTDSTANTSAQSASQKALLAGLISQITGGTAPTDPELTCVSERTKNISLEKALASIAKATSGTPSQEQLAVATAAIQCNAGGVASQISNSLLGSTADATDPVSRACFSQKLVSKIVTDEKAIADFAKGTAKVSKSILGYEIDAIKSCFRAEQQPTLIADIKTRQS